jgi:putative ABC transport system permease protein
MRLRAPRFIRRLLALATWEARDDEMNTEMGHHLEALTSEFMRAGMSREEAESAARRRFGHLQRLKEEGHAVRSSRIVEDLVRDVRHTVRGLRRSPGFAVAVTLTLALGIGGNTAMFSVVDQLLLRPLPYPEGDQLLVIYERFKESTLGDAAERNSVSPANWLDWQRQNRTLQDIAVWRTQIFTLTGVGEPARLSAQAVSAEFFPVLGVRPLLGRVLTAEDDRPAGPGARRTVVISHRLWQRTFGGDPNIVGRIIELNARPAEVVGVMPESFRFIYLDNDVWSALALNRDQPWRENAGRFISTVARLKPGVPVAAARADLDAISAHLEATHEFNKGTGVTIVPLREVLTGQVQTSLVMLYGAVAVLLAIACFNVANLLLARASSRSGEIAVRASLGAGRVAILRQLLVESLLLATAGGILGIALAHWSLDALMAFAPPDLLRVPELSVDRRVLLYAFAVSALTGLIIGLAPALLVARRSVASSMRSGSTKVTHAPRIRQALVIGQVAMTVILLCGAGLLVRTVLALNGAADGFDKRDLLTMEVTLSPARYNPDQRTAFYRAVIVAVRGLPGVESAAAANSLAVIGSPRGGTGVHFFGTPELPMNESPSATIRVVTPGYFKTMRTPVLRGREFTEADDVGAAYGFIVNEAFVRAYLSETDPLGVRMAVWMQETNPYLPIIGVVGDVSEGSVRDGAQPTVFYSHRLMPEVAMTLIMRTATPTAIAGPAMAAIHRLDPKLPVTKVQTFEHALGEAVARERLNALVSAGLALSGLLLASLGVYGLLAFIVAERTKEMAIRIALGADVRRLTGSVVAGGLHLVAVGALIGVVGSSLLLRWLGTLLFEVTPYDVPTYAVVLGLLAAVAAAASYIPARHAGRIEPLLALRQE